MSWIAANRLRKIAFSKYRLLCIDEKLFSECSLSCVVEILFVDWIIVLKMENSQPIELSTVVQSDLMSINDSKVPVSLEGIDTLVQTICDSLTKIPNSDQSNDVIRHLEGKLRLVVSNKNIT